MPVLHFRITNNNEIINIDRDIHGQNFTFKRAVVVKDATASTAYKGGVSVKLDFLSSGVEILSNTNNDIVYLPFNDTNTVSDIRYDLNFSSEVVRRSFKTSVYSYDRISQPSFDTTGTTGELFYIDLYFEFQQITDFDEY